MNVKDLTCYPQVAAVIGEALAEYELQRVINSKCEFDKGSPLLDAFVWDDTPQRDDFWEHIEMNRNPYDHGHEKPEVKEWVYLFGEWLGRCGDYYSDSNGCNSIHKKEISGVGIHRHKSVTMPNWVPGHTGPELQSWDEPIVEPNEKLKAAFAKTKVMMFDKERSDGSTASYYELPEGATELQHLISHRNMNHAIGSIFSLCYDHSKNAHSSIETAIEIRRMAEFEIKRLEEMQGM